MSNQTNSPIEPPAGQQPNGATSTSQTGTWSLANYRWRKGLFGMAICCAAALGAIAAGSFFGLSLSALASWTLIVVALLACPVGMYFMMRVMAKHDKS